MSLLHFEPFRPLRDLDRLSQQLLSASRVPQAMPMDVWREGQTYHVALDLPGVGADSIEVQVEGNTLTVSAQRQSVLGVPPGAQGEQPDQGRSREQGQFDVLVAERPHGSFSRRLVLGEGLDLGAIQADYTDGVLYLRIPLAQSAQPRRIQVGSSGQGSTQPRVIESEHAQPN